MNCLALEQDDGILIVDCGSAFPNDDLGIDVYHPDFSWLVERAPRIAGVFLTHGHEDHIGGLPYLLADLDIPVWGPPHALELVRRRLFEHDFGPSEIDLRTAHAGQRYEVGPFEVEPVRVAHSIVEASALCIETAAGRVLHTGDFNFDPNPPDGEPTDEGRLSEIGDAGVALLLSDSTNIDVLERPGSEQAVADTLEHLVQNASGRCLVALFASNVQRLIKIGQIARRVGRKVCLLGRSLETQVNVATRIGRLDWPSDLLVSPDQAAGVPRDRLLVLAGGTQAERNSALRRISLGQHPLLTLEAGDTVILSSRAIPGNERSVIAMINDLLRAGVHVHSRITDPGVHTSGHAGRGEQRRMLELVRPRCFLPVHGTLHHLLRHAALGRELGVESTLVVENGTPVICDGHHLLAETEVAHGKVAIAYGGERLDAATLQARTDLARYGIAIVVLVVDDDGQLAARPKVTTRGIPTVDGQAHALRALALEVERAFTAFREGRGLSLDEFVRRATRRKVEDLAGIRPVVSVEMIRLEDV